MFGDGWDSQFQYEDKDGTTIGCYIDKNYIKKADEAYTQYLDDMAGMADELEKKCYGEEMEGKKKHDS